MKDSKEKTEKKNINTRKEKTPVKKTVINYLLLTFAALLLGFANHVFKIPNNFAFGGVTGISIILAKFLPVSVSTITLVLNVTLLVVGWIVINKSFAFKTVYVSLLFSGSLSLMENFFPLDGPVTDEPMLEFIFAVILPAFASAIFFNLECSSGGTDIVAMILNKYTSINIGRALLISDMAICVSGFFVYGVKTGLFCVAGLMMKSLVIDTVIESFNRCKCFTVICEKPEPICEFIHNSLNRSATLLDATGAYTGAGKTEILTVLKPRQAIKLRSFIKSTEPGAFLIITNSSEIIGKGFTRF
ncbi:MAG: YitT family protein [Clostridia bacterium]|nr:YitT family protein [Clostridia bacterium]